MVVGGGGERGGCGEAEKQQSKVNVVGGWWVVGERIAVIGRLC